MDHFLWLEVILKRCTHPPDGCNLDYIKLSLMIKSKFKYLLLLRVPVNGWI